MSVHVVSTAADLPDAVRHAERATSSRWYVARRAKDLGQEHRVPKSWGLTAALAAYEPEAVTAAFDGDWTPPGRDKAAKKGEALDDGSFPIADKADLERAIKSYGRAKNKDEAKKHIVKRAKALKATDCLPDTWGVTASVEPVVAAGTGWDPSLHPRDRKGRWIDKLDLLSLFNGIGDTRSSARGTAVGSSRVGSKDYINVKVTAVGEGSKYQVGQEVSLEAASVEAAPRAKGRIDAPREGSGFGVDYVDPFPQEEWDALRGKKVTIKVKDENISTRGLLVGEVVKVDQGYQAEGDDPTRPGDTGIVVGVNEGPYDDVRVEMRGTGEIETFRPADLKRTDDSDTGEEIDDSLSGRITEDGEFLEDGKDDSYPIDLGTVDSVVQETEPTPEGQTQIGDETDPLNVQEPEAPAAPADPAEPEGGWRKSGTKADPRTVQQIPDEELQQKLAEADAIVAQSPRGIGPSASNAKRSQAIQTQTAYRRESDRRAKLRGEDPLADVDTTPVSQEDAYGDSLGEGATPAEVLREAMGQKGLPNGVDVDEGIAQYLDALNDPEGEILANDADLDAAMEQALIQHVVVAGEDWDSPENYYDFWDQLPEGLKTRDLADTIDNDLDVRFEAKTLGEREAAEGAPPADLIEAGLIEAGLDVDEKIAESVASYTDALGDEFDPSDIKNAMEQALIEHAATSDWESADQYRQFWDSLPESLKTDELRNAIDNDLDVRFDGESLGGPDLLDPTWGKDQRPSVEDLDTRDDEDGDALRFDPSDTPGGGDVSSMDADSLADHLEAEGLSEPDTWEALRAGDIKGANEAFETSVEMANDGGDPAVIAKTREIENRLAQLQNEGGESDGANYAGNYPDDIRAEFDAWAEQVRAESPEDAETRIQQIYDRGNERYRERVEEGSWDAVGAEAATARGTRDGTNSMGEDRLAVFPVGDPGQYDFGGYEVWHTNPDGSKNGGRGSYPDRETAEAYIEANNAAQAARREEQVSAIADRIVEKGDQTPAELRARADEDDAFGGNGVYSEARRRAADRMESGSGDSEGVSAPAVDDEETARANDEDDARRLEGYQDAFADDLSDLGVDSDQMSEEQWERVEALFYSDDTTGARGATQAEHVALVQQIADEIKGGDAGSPEGGADWTSKTTGEPTDRDMLNSAMFKMLVTGRRDSDPSYSERDALADARWDRGALERQIGEGRGTVGLKPDHGTMVSLSLNEASALLDSIDSMDDDEIADGLVDRDSGTSIPRDVSGRGGIAPGSPEDEVQAMREEAIPEAVDPIQEMRDEVAPPPPGGPTGKRIVIVGLDNSRIDVRKDPDGGPDKVWVEGVYAGTIEPAPGGAKGFVVDGERYKSKKAAAEAVAKGAGVEDISAETRWSRARAGTDTDLGNLAEKMRQNPTTPEPRAPDELTDAELDAAIVALDSKRLGGSLSTEENDTLAALRETQRQRMRTQAASTTREYEAAEAAAPMTRDRLKTMSGFHLTGDPKAYKNEDGEILGYYAKGQSTSRVMDGRIQTGRSVDSSGYLIFDENGKQLRGTTLTARTVAYAKEDLDKALEKQEMRDQVTPSAPAAPAGGSTHPAVTPERIRGAKAEVTNLGASLHDGDDAWALYNDGVWRSQGSQGWGGWDRNPKRNSTPEELDALLDAKIEQYRLQDAAGQKGMRSASAEHIARVAEGARASRTGPFARVSTGDLVSRGEAGDEAAAREAARREISKMGDAELARRIGELVRARDSYDAYKIVLLEQMQAEQLRRAEALSRQTQSPR